MPPRKKPEIEAAAAADPVLDARGQILVPLGGENYVLRPSRAAISAIERQTRPLAHLAQAAAGEALTIEEMAICAAEMMKAYGAAHPDDALASSYRGADVAKLADLIFDAGAPRICARLYVVLYGALQGGYTAEGEAKPATRTE